MCASGVQALRLQAGFGAETVVGHPEVFRIQAQMTWLWVPQPRYAALPRALTHGRLHLPLQGNISRFINHSCEPNCETQKWLVAGELAIGLFAVRDIPKDSELTFDYNFERYGDKPMRCYCGSTNCRKFIGGQQVRPGGSRTTITFMQQRAKAQSPKRRRGGQRENGYALAGRGCGCGQQRRARTLDLPPVMLLGATWTSMP